MNFDNQQEVSQSLHSDDLAMEAESSVLAMTLQDNKDFDRVNELLTSSDFCNRPHQLIYAAMADLINAGKPADVLGVNERLLVEGNADEVGGLSYLNSLTTNVPGSSYLGRDVEIVRNQAVLRKLVQTCSDITATAVRLQGSELEAILDEAIQKLANLGDALSSPDSGFQCLGFLAEALLERVTDRSDNPNEITGVPTGLEDLDRMTSGMHAGELIVLAAASSSERTTLAIKIATHVALKEGLPVAYFSMGVKAANMTERIVGFLAEISPDRLRTGRLSEEEQARLNAVIETLSTAPLHIAESTELTLNQVKAAARRLARQCGRLGLVVLDCLQLVRTTSFMDGPGKAMTVREIAHSLKLLASELNCPVIALYQINSSVQTLIDERPLLCDLNALNMSARDVDVLMLLRSDAKSAHVRLQNGTLSAIPMEHGLP